MFFYFFIYDFQKFPKAFEKRMEILHKLCNGRINIRVVEQRKIDNDNKIPQLLKEVEKLGAEGLMLREPGSLYIGKRSTTLLKVKSFFDDEAKVIGYATTGKGRLAGMTGSLMLQDRNGVKFDCGSGMNDNDRRNPPAIGTIVTFRYQEKSDRSGRPRFPIFIGLAIDKTFP
jgi:DNA ligase-1